MGDNWRNMSPNVPKKNQTMREISVLLGIPEIAPTAGSSIPSIFFTSIASEMGIPPVHGMPNMARKIIEASHLDWNDKFSSESTPSGGGGTVTAIGLLQVKNAVLAWLGEDLEELPALITNQDWMPNPDWKNIRDLLPRETLEVISRPGASDFRQQVLTEYDSQCAISGYRAVEAIDVAHIVPYYGPESDDIQNALPLRADFHRLFDRGLIRIAYNMPQRNFIVKMHDQIIDDYFDYHDKELILPNDPLSHPSKSALLHQHVLFKELWTVI
jgi:hypothetical protein